jgi:hypothetical protein
MLLNKTVCLLRKITENMLELREESLDVNLIENCLKIKFTDGVLLPGLSIFETPTSVCILVATTNSVHKIVFPHPSKIHSHVSYFATIISSFLIKSEPLFTWRRSSGQSDRKVKWIDILEPPLYLFFMLFT